MTLREELKKAIETDDSRLLFRVIDSLRFGCSYTYQEICNMACADCNITPEDFEECMQELKYTE